MYGLGNLFATQVPKTANEKRIRPGFVLFLEAVSQLIKQNPLAFEMNCGYTSKLASLIFTNRYFEFVQSEDFISLEVVEQTTREAQVREAVSAQVASERKETSKLLSVFD